MVDKLFVYGTLCFGQPNDYILRNMGGLWEEASVTGTLHNEGWGSAMGCPGITLNEDGDKVEGFLFTSLKLSQHWAALDEFEGDDYERVMTTVTLKNNMRVEAFIYVLQRS